MMYNPCAHPLLGTQNLIFNIIIARLPHSLISTYLVYVEEEKENKI